MRSVIAEIQGVTMLRKFLIVGISAGVSAAVPTLYQSNPEALATMLSAVIGEPEPDRQQVSAIASTRAPVTNAPLGRKFELAADPRGHFTADFRLNGRLLPAMIDTGATLVAINASTARKIGISLRPHEFRYKVETANGPTKAATATIDNLQIGRIVIDKVQAVVLEDKALSGTLIGMNFLNRLGKFEIKNGTLVMVQ
ncbi:TIGR02281 family clan AA aspartic protease [Mesorhizobium sp. 1B3]|uniref:TIGR02281 family clan AA aspartic protease n=1 Tax=Mesorhizobium sp. 1B3 TaxID=3243599 RepID=UPI003D995CFB